MKTNTIRTPSTSLSRVIAIMGVLLTGCSFSQADTILLSDNFTSGTLADWHFYNTGATGTAWSIATDNTAPLSGYTLNHPTGTTAANTWAFRQFTTTTLVNQGDFIDLKMDIRNTAPGGTLYFDLLNTSATLTGNYFGTANPIADADGYNTNQALNATASSVGIRTDTDFVRTVVTGTNDHTSIIGDTAPHAYELKLTLVATGVQLETYMDGVLQNSYLDTSDYYTTFNTLSIAGNNGGNAYFDNIVITSSVPEPSAMALLAASLIGLLFWKSKRKLVLS